MNSPNNNIYISLLKKIYCVLIIVGICFTGFGQDDEIDLNGFNVFYYDSGEKASEGFFKNGLPDGQWKVYYLSGKLKSIGNKKDGKSDSIWTFYDKNGLLNSTYFYANDMKHGCATRFDSLGNIAQETFYVDDKRQGELQWFFTDGTLRKSQFFSNDREHGLSIEYNEAGIIITEEYFSNGFLRNRTEFNRFDKNGKKTGQWRTYFPNGNIETEITYDAGKKDGTAKEFDPEGKLVAIQTMQGDSVVSGQGAIVMVDLYREYHQNGKVKLVGGLTKGLKSGIFREYNQKGEMVMGYVYRRDTMVSEGLIQAGGIFEGVWKTYYKNGNLKAIGPFKNGEKNGKWDYYYPDGKREQSGKFKRNGLSGQWIWYYHNGQMKREEFYGGKGLLEGTVTEYDSLGNELARGEYYNGKREGAWFYQVGDFKEVGTFTLGEPDGIWTYFYQNGKIAFSGEFMEGEPKGKHIYYHKNGLRKLVGKYAGGERHGVWREFNNRGEQVETIYYKQGEIYKINGFRVKKIEAEG